MELQINNITDLEQLVIKDKITPLQAEKILIKSLNLLAVDFGIKTVTKERILNTIDVLKNSLENNEVPLFSLSQIRDEAIQEYSIKNVFK
ncbi:MULTISPECIES: hypothetical protein [Flavobacterium]|uniref:Uncharacterized protein n=1 Tax=Flavobacterium keumense TaxID=1306518 RepID=A0ABY8N4X0_9FLAO|nr:MULTISPECIES: hypothetical protein [Flavobacterium]WGK94258.1 hypothetical protein MG292_09245 [Flavobacterium keumense]